VVLGITTVDAVRLRIYEYQDGGTRNVTWSSQYPKGTVSFEPQ